MIFTQIKQVLDGTKTQTRRQVKEDEWIIYDEKDGKHRVMTPGNRVKWRVGQDYAVIPGRGKKGIVRDGKSVRYIITDIREEPLQAISHAEVKREGVQHLSQYVDLWNSICGNWNENPNVWVISFELLA